MFCVYRFSRRLIRVSIITAGMDKDRSIMGIQCRKILMRITEATLVGISSHHRWGSNLHSSNKSGSATSWRECSYLHYVLFAYFVMNMFTDTVYISLCLSLSLGEFLLLNTDTEGV